MLHRYSVVQIRFNSTVKLPFTEGTKNNDRYLKDGNPIEVIINDITLYGTKNNYRYIEVTVNGSFTVYAKFLKLLIKIYINILYKQLYLKLVVLHM